MSMTPAGDMANALFLRRQTATLKSAISRHSQELTTGRSADPLRKLKGDTTALAAIERSRTTLTAYETTTVEAGLHTAGQQSVLDRLRKSAMDVSGQLLNFGTAVPPQMIETAARIGRSAFDDAVGALNTRLGDRSLFAGVASDGPALAPAQDIVDALRLAIADATTAEEVSDAVFAWFDPPGAGFLAGGYLGQAAPEGPLEIAPGERLNLSITADREEFRSLLGGLALAAVIEDGALEGQVEARAELLQTAAVRLAGAPLGLTALAGELGDAEARIEAAATRNANQRTALELALSDLVTVDSFDAATRLEETRVRIESLFALTARLQRMSLTEFLR